MSDDTFPIVITTQYIKDLSFEHPNTPHSLFHAQSAPQIGVHFNVNFQDFKTDEDQNKKTHEMSELTLSIRVEAKHEDKVVFIADLAYAGLFLLDDVPADQRDILHYVEGPRLLFPFCRSLIATLTREAGFPALLITPIDFEAVYQQRLEEIQKESKTAKSK